jgi:hypothetical protein
LSFSPYLLTKELFTTKTLSHKVLLFFYFFLRVSRKGWPSHWCLGGKYLALLHGFSHIHRPAGPTLVPYHLATLARPHTHQKSALAIPLNLTLAMIFHALSPILKKPTNFTAKIPAGIIHHTCPNEKTLSLADFPKFKT